MRLPKGIRRHHDGYRAVVSVEGKRVYGPTRSSVEDAMEDRLRMRGRIGDIPAQLATLADGYELLRTDAKKHASPETQRYYEQQIRALRRHFQDSAPLHHIRRQHIDAFVSKRLDERVGKPPEKGETDTRKSVTGETIRKNLRTIGRIYTLAIDAGWCSEGDRPFGRGYINRVRHDKPGTDWLTIEELRAVLDKLYSDGRPEDADVIAFLSYTGLRRMEAARLEKSDIDLKRGCIFVRGKRGNREIPIASEAAPLCARLCLRERPFPGGVGELRRACDRAKRLMGDDKRLHPHALRHSFGAALSKSHTPAVVARLMGHASLAMVMRYFHLTGKDAQAAINSISLTHPSKSPEQETRAE